MCKKYLKQPCSQAHVNLLHVGTLDWRQINPDIFGSMIQAVAAAEGPATTFAISIIRMPSNGPVISDYSLFVPQYTEACHLTSRDNH